MKVGILGAGFTGLTVGYFLSKKGINVTIFEKEKNPGGLAVGYYKKGWKWPLEKHYHHLFVSDWEIRNLAKEIDHPIFFKRPKTSVFGDNKIFQFDSPLHLFSYPSLSFLDKIRTALLIGFLKINPVWKPFEYLTARKLVTKIGGENSWKVIWEPLFRGKFGKYSDRISAAWFWSRINKRSVSLGYPKGGFLGLAKSIAGEIKKNKGSIFFNTSVLKAKYKDSKFTVEYLKGSKKEVASFDYLISTLPMPLFVKIFPNLPKYYKNKVSSFINIGAINLILRLKKSFFPDKTYWLSINDLQFPFLALVEHTNLISKKNYNNEHLLYVGKYLPHSHKYFLFSKDKLLSEYNPFLKKINPDYEKSLVGYDIFKAYNAQPIVSVNYSKRIPDFKTPIKNLYVATLQQVYPWDRGTNYAVLLGKKVAKLVK